MNEVADPGEDRPRDGGDAAEPEHPAILTCTAPHRLYLLLDSITIRIWIVLLSACLCQPLRRADEDLGAQPGDRRVGPDHQVLPAGGDLAAGPADRGQPGRVRREPCP